MVAIDLVGEGRGQKDNRRGRGTRWRQDVDRHDVFDVTAAQADAINPGRHSGRNFDGEIRFPSRSRRDRLHGSGLRRSGAAYVASWSLRRSNGSRAPPASAGYAKAHAGHAVGRDLRAEVPPRQAFGLAGLDWGSTLTHALEDRGVLQPPVEKAAVRVLVWSGLRRRRGTERQLPERTKASRHFGRAGIGHSPTALHGSLTQPQLPGGGDHAQLVPTSFEHRRGHLSPAAA